MGLFQQAPPVRYDVYYWDSNGSQLKSDFFMSNAETFTMVAGATIGIQLEPEYIICVDQEGNGDHYRFREVVPVEDLIPLANKGVINLYVLPLE